MSNIFLVAETGADIPPALAQKHNIYLVPMHVTMGDRTLDDGAFPTEDICKYYDRTGQLPKTSGCSPEDFKLVFDAIHTMYPEKHILHLAYSAVTTVSFASARIAAEGLDYVTSIDTKHVSAGQTIGGIGSTGLFESLEPAHLHLELLKDGVYVNPMDYLHL